MRYVMLVIALALPGSVRAMDIDGPLDQFGNEFHLSTWGEDRLVVVTFLGMDCPLAGLYANRLHDLHDRYANRGVLFVAVNSDQHDSYEDMVHFAEQLQLPFSILKDEGNTVADEFGATHSPQVFLLDPSRDVIYQGRIDDQYEPGVHTRTAPSRHDLEAAILEALEWKSISVPETQPAGCRIDRIGQPTTTSDVTYTEHIAPIFDAKCAGCHRPGEAAPFSLLSYDDAIGWTETIRDVVAERRMPPWNAESPFPLAHDLGLTAGQRGLILAWIDSGAAQGDPAARPAPPKFVEGWTMKPDLVLSMPEPFVVPKEGLLDYQEYVIDPGFSADRWVEAIEIRPGNTKVVHHATIYLKPKDAKPGMFYFDEMFDNYLALYVPGNSLTELPPGSAKRIPAGFNFHLSVHYVPNGVEQSDQTSIGLRFAEAPSVQVATRMNAGPITLNPGEIKTVEANMTLEKDSLLFALYPHMHLRGKSMEFTAFYPDGREQELLNVPQYDFEWQHRYVLANPLQLPAGTVLRCTAVYDNSSANPRNPDPTATVTSGDLTTDEMFFGAFEIGRPVESHHWLTPAYTLAAVAIGALWLVHKRAGKSKAA